MRENRIGFFFFIKSSDAFFAIAKTHVLKLLALFGAEGQLAPDWSDEVVVGVTVARDGEINHAPTAEALGVAHVAITPETKEIA